MVINAIRMRGRGQEEWHAIRLGLGTGRLRNYQCLVAPKATLHQVATALDYALTGRESPAVFEVAVQLGDDAGHTWVVHRKPGQTRYLKDGVQLAEEVGSRGLNEALMELEGAPEGGDHDAPQAEIGRFQIQATDDGLTRVGLGATASPQQALKDVARRQLAEVAAEGARLIGLPALADARVLARLARHVAPLHAQYRELCRQYADLKESQGEFTEKDLAVMHTLAAEIELMKHLDEAAAPLLAPGVSLKALKDEVAAADAQIAELNHALGLDTQDGAPAPRDFRKPIEALCRLEAHAKLIRASQGARKYCEQNLEPRFKRYVESAAGGLAGDRQVAQDLESCLATLTLRLNTAAPAAPAPPVAGTPTPPGLKTWFDRFKTRHAEEVAQGEATGAPEAAAGASPRETAELETARMAIEYALSRITELGAGVNAAREKHESALTALDEAHEELVRNFARLRDHWVQIAREAALPEDLDLARLLKVVVSHGRLAAMIDQRDELARRLKQHQTRAARAEQLLVEWRRATGSQKLADLSNPSILLAEARDVLRYQDVKKKRFDQLTAAAADAKGALAVRSMLRGRRKTLMAAWQAAFQEAGLTPLEIHDPQLDELFRRAGLIEALALVHGAAAAAAPARLFDESGPERAMALYLWDDARLEDDQKLQFLEHLEAARGHELRLLLLADASLGELLQPLGMGHGMIMPPRPAAVPDPVMMPKPAEAPRPTPTIPKRASTPLTPKGPETTAALNERAKRTLELLAVKKP